MIYQAHIETVAYGYTQAALLHLSALYRAGRRDVTLAPLGSVINWRQMPSWASDLGQIGAAPGISREVCLAHHLPGSLTMIPLLGERKNLGLTTLETDEAPRWICDKLNQRFDGLLVPSLHNAEAFRAGGVQVPISVIGHPMVEEWWNLDAWGPEAAGWRRPKRPWTFYYVGAWNTRKNPEAVLRAFLRAFPGNKPRTDVVLAMKLSGPRSFEPYLRQVVREECGTDDRFGEDVWCWVEQWPEPRVRWLHEIGDCYVSAHRGEGWGLGLFQAALLGRPVVYTDWSAPAEYLGAQHGHFPVKSYTLEDVGLLGGNADLFFPSKGQTLRWAQPSDDDLVATMQQAYALRDDREMADGRVRHALAMRETYGMQRVGKAMVDALGLDP